MIRIVLFAIMLIRLAYAQNQLDSVSLRLLYEAKNHYNHEEFDQAIQKYSQVIEFNEGIKSANLFYYLAFSYYYIGEFQKAIPFFAKSIDYMKLRKADYKDKSWKSKSGININDMLKVDYVIEFNDSTGYTNDADAISYSLTVRKSDALLFKAICKYNIDDYIGAIVDLRKYHNTTLDSSSISCAVFGTSLFYMNQYTLSKKYLTRAINLCDKETPRYTDNKESPLGRIYYYRGLCNGNLSLRLLACQDFSMALEYGYKEAYEEIKEHCDYSKD